MVFERSSHNFCWHILHGKCNGIIFIMLLSSYATIRCVFSLPLQCECALWLEIAVAITMWTKLKPHSHGAGNSNYINFLFSICHYSVVTFLYYYYLFLPLSLHHNWVQNAIPWLNDERIVIFLRSVKTFLDEEHENSWTFFSAWHTCCSENIIFLFFIFMFCRFKQVQDSQIYLNETQDSPDKERKSLIIKVHKKPNSSKWATRLY